MVSASAITLASSKATMFFSCIRRVYRSERGWGVFGASPHSSCDSRNVSCECLTITPKNTVKFPCRVLAGSQDYLTQKYKRLIGCDGFNKGCEGYSVHL